MNLLKRLTTKVGKTVSTAVSESVKTEAKNAVVGFLPLLVGIGCVWGGFSLFKAALTVAAPAMMGAPTLSTTSVVTNNYFFDPSVQAELVARLINK